MDDIFKDEKAQGWVIIYMDDIFIFTKELLDNICNTRKILQQLWDNDLYLKPEKCSFWQMKVEYLGLIIKEGKIGIDLTKLKGITDWPEPMTVKQVRSFLGFGNYYRQFIHGYGDLTKPLNDLLEKEENFDWTEEQQKTFNELKRQFQEAPVLQMPDLSKPFVVETDASKFASGGILWQQDMNGDWHPCSYISKSFSETKQNYKIYDWELLVIIWALTEWRHYLQGSQHPTTILSNHKNLMYFKTAQKLNRRQARWHLTLSEYDIKLIHVPGKQMVQSDTLSWQPDLCPDEDTDNEDKILLPDTMFVRLIDTELRDLIATNKQHDTVILEAIQALQGGKRLLMNSKIDDWTFDNGLIFYNNKCYVPNNLDLWWKILEKYHNTIPIGHPGQLHTQ